MSTRLARLMIIDDDDDTAFLFRQIFKNELEIISVSNSADLLQFLASSPVDLLVMDHYLGSVTSTDLVPKVRLSDHGRALAIVLYSGVNNLEEVAARVQASGYIKKPSSIALIRSSIIKFMEIAGR